MQLFDIFGFALVGVLLGLSIWAFYNMPIFVVGVKDFLKKRQKPQKSHALHPLPVFSIIVPVKNEERVVGRLIDALQKLQYPADKKDIIIVEEASTDRTPEICRNFARKYSNIQILSRPISEGKPAALNFGLKHAKGDIIAVFDADNIPAPDALLTVTKYFADANVAAVQGKTLSLNSKENMITQFSFYEEAVWCEVYLRGKDVLNLFVHLRGSCQFVRRAVLEKLKGFNEKALCEDMELSARLTEKGYRIRYASDVVALQESPSNFKTLFGQRTRWFRGTMEVALRYGRLMSKVTKRNFDAEATLFGPFALIASLFPYLAAFWTFSTLFNLNIVWNYLALFALLTTAISIFTCGVALVYVTKPRKIKNLLWLPFVYLYWSFQALVASYALILIILRKPKHWTKTEKKGTITDSGQLSSNNIEIEVLSESEQCLVGSS